MADPITVEHLSAWLRHFAATVDERHEYLTELDSAIGDADHGVNMTRGMRAVVEKLDAGAPEFADDLFKAVGMALVSSVGGASGPLYGTFFLRLGTKAGHVSEVDASSFGQALRAGLEGVIARGKAEVGDKTMLDAMVPAVEAFERSAADGSGAATAADAAASASEEGRDATEPIVARKGRASYLGDRSVGHLDPGATSTAMLFRSLATALAA
ncbi:dihydroxyacetone kinase subunit L [Pseudoclavibacter endophyticus]|uniref:Dihydroxyacetone kinase subunit L n=1 Tax=Pseudoclavibacter endophyticus TaxID=1778590 RepID=A0A6H9WS01_9MICO|nr:dihydroxyacetone kinase subunit DhaL [Pseudoclavibacter endophyticus]KAB1649555.1 dihydroxyacetone kinase subunit L [Pseudoclavibacter endophyticus]GGA61663.1 dihydroxyacetone kinase subunit L [Pseudoclavibacter endophyticus]